MQGTLGRGMESVRRLRSNLVISLVRFTSLRMRADWCRNKGHTVSWVRGDRNCLYTCLGKGPGMEPDEIRNDIVNKAFDVWTQ
eukprot:9126015-Heterocapsa_arctica.AAC.1